MKPDYYAFLGENKYANGFAGIDYSEWDAVATRYHQLVATGHKEDKDTGANALRSQWSKQRLNVDLGPLSDFLRPADISVAFLPWGAFNLQIAFRLLKPYISRDDNQFYIIDNPIVREKVFRYPLVRATAWKGSLRHALWQMGFQTEDEQIRRLFGTVNDEMPEEGNDGRLYFYPTFFTQTSLEIINPHDRERRIGKNPIYFECVPAGATGHFTLLYAPLDSIGEDPAATRRQIAADLKLLAQGLEALFTLYGFGAKTSSGFGLAELTGAGHFAIHYPDGQEQTPRPQPPVYPESLRDFLASYPPEYLDMKPKQLKDAGVPNLLRQQAKEIKELYQQYQSDLAQYESDLAEWEASAATPPPPITERTFAAFSDLAEIAEQTGGDA